jgi:SAM-dependent methyltransferase
MPELPTCYTVDVTERAPYLLEHVDRELERLLALAEREAEQVRLACRQVGLAQGGSAIDVGCGPLGALRTLAEVVGERGRVVGLDASADAIGRAREVCRALGLGRVELVCADALRCDFAQLRLWRAFDLAYCRLCLLHQRDPGQLLARLGALVRPGGFIAYQDILDEPSFPRCEPDRWPISSTATRKMLWRQRVSAEASARDKPVSSGSRKLNAA